MNKLLILFSILSFSLPGLAAQTGGDLTQIRQELLSLLKRVESLEAENVSLREQVQVNATKVETTGTRSKSSWTDTLKVSGDLRARYESFDVENKDDRERSRVRARVAIKAKPTDNTEVAIGLASGGDDPNSTNQTLGGGASTKDVRLDLAYFKWQAKPGLTLTGGKMKNPWFEPGGNHLIWDGDLRPEGLALTYRSDSLFLNSALHYLESDTKKNNARLAYGLQTGYDGKIAAGHLTVGVSYFKVGAEGRAPWYNDDFYGNSSTCIGTDCSYANDFEEVELFAQIKTSVLEQPLTLFADYVQDQDASRLDTAWAAGFKLGKASAPDTWEIGYIYQDVEADSIFGFWNDSDFGGGDTDSKGHILKGAWAINKKWKVGFTYFDNVTNVDLGSEEDYDRLQVDWAYKF